MHRSPTVLAAVLAVAVFVASGCGDDDTADGTTTTTTTTTIAEGDPGGGVDDAGVEALIAVGSFMDARVLGSGAEAFLTDEAREIYPDEIPLYDVAEFEVGDSLGADANSFEITVEVVDDDGDVRTETMFVGPGEIDGDPSPFAIRGAVDG